MCDDAKHRGIFHSIRYPVSDRVDQGFVQMILGIRQQHEMLLTEIGSEVSFFSQRLTNVFNQRNQFR